MTRDEMTQAMSDAEAAYWDELEAEQNAAGGASCSASSSSQ